MDVILPTALPVDNAKVVPPFELTYVDSNQEEERQTKPTLLSPIKLTEKKTTRKVRKMQSIFERLCC
jgi:hypothetical protein